MVVGDQAAVDVGLREGVADAQGRAAQPQRAVARGRGDRVDQLGRRVVHVGGLEHAAGEHVAGRAFVDRGAGVGRQNLFVVDRRDRDVEGAAGAGSLAVVDAEVEAVGGRLTAVVVVGDQAAVDVGLREGVADAEGRAAQPQRAVGRWPTVTV